MKKLYEKNETAFAILWIAAYVVLSNIADIISAGTGVVKSATSPLHIVMSLILFTWIRKNGLSEKYGLCRPGLSARTFLFYFPLAVIASSALWNGISLRYGLPGSLFYFVSMCCVGFLEEVIMRGLLFRAMEKDGVRSAVIVSSLTFGFGHIVNLLNGSKDAAESAQQIFFAVLVGFVLVLIFYYGGSLIPCILFHSANNALFAFGAEGTMDPGAQMILNFTLMIFILGGYLVYLCTALPKITHKRL